MLLEEERNRGSRETPEASKPDTEESEKWGIQNERKLNSPEAKCREIVTGYIN